jgi:type IV pilus assembly protein PilM
MSREITLLDPRMAVARRVRPWQLGRMSARVDQVIGVHLDALYAQAVLVKRAINGVISGEPTVTNFFEEPMAPEAIVDGALTNPTAIAETLRRLRMALHATDPDARVVMGIDGHDVIIKHMYIPEMPEEDTKQCFAFEVKQYIPFKINEVNVDWEPCANCEHVREGCRRILFAATKSERVRDFAQITRDAGWHLDAIECDAKGLVRLTDVDPSQPNTTAVVHVGDALTNLTVSSGRSILFTRDISMGLYQLIDEIQRRLNLSFNDAHTRLLQALDDPAQELEGEFRAVCDAFSDALATELHRSLDFFSTTEDGVPERLMVCGRLADLPVFTSHLADYTGLMAEPMTLPSHMHHRFAPALGLALRAYFDDTRVHQGQPTVKQNLARGLRQLANFMDPR